MDEAQILTDSEREIVQLLYGKSNKEAASHLGISVKTVETHRAAIMRKLDLKSITELVRYAIRNCFHGQKADPILMDDLASNKSVARIGHNQADLLWRAVVLLGFSCCNSERAGINSQIRRNIL